MARASLKTLRMGEIAPNFRTKSILGKPLSLDAMRGTKIWLAFFRYASCPLCNLRVNEIIKRHSALSDQGVRVISVWQSPPNRMREYVVRQQPPFDMISDPHEDLYDLYGLRSGLGAMFGFRVGMKMTRATLKGYFPGHMDGTISRIPADFLIDENGFLQDVFYGRDISDHIPFGRVDHFAAQPLHYPVDRPRAVSFEV